MLKKIILFIRGKKNSPQTNVPATLPEGFPKSARWKGLGDAPKWEGQLPAKVQDFQSPRYVYQDLTESTIPLSTHGRVIGYRIGASLVIHSQVGYGNGWKEEHIVPFMERYGGKLLNGKEVLVLAQYWEIVSRMRQNIADAALPELPFWTVDPQGYPVAFNPLNSKKDYTPKKACIILKR